MALARRRCYSIERLLRGVQISLALPFSTSLSPLLAVPHSTPSQPLKLRFLLVLPLLRLPLPRSSTSSSSVSSSCRRCSQHRHSHARARSYTHTQNRYLSFWRSRRRPSVSVLPSDGFSWPDDVLSLHAVVPGWRPSLSAPPCSSSSPRGVRQARGVEVAGLRSPLRLSLSFSSLLFSCSLVPLSRRRESAAVIRGSGRLSILSLISGDTTSRSTGGGYLWLAAATPRHLDATRNQRRAFEELQSGIGRIGRSRGVLPSWWDCGGCARMVYGQEKDDAPGSRAGLLIFGWTGVMARFLGISNGVGEGETSVSGSLVYSPRMPFGKHWSTYLEAPTSANFVQARDSADIDFFQNSRSLVEIP